MSTTYRVDGAGVVCPTCGIVNQATVDLGGIAVCMSCNQPLDEASWLRRRLQGLQSNRYEHPIDRQALQALQKTAGFELMVRKFNEHGLDQLIKVECTGSNLKVTPSNYPELHSALREVCEVLDLQQQPELYVEAEDHVNAYTAGVEAPLICLSSGCVDLLTREEMFFVLGHEVGHIKSQHLLYTQIAMLIPLLGKLVGKFTLNLGEVLSMGLQSALVYWYRMSEYTADRAGLLACQDVDVAARTFIKMAGLPGKYYNRIDVPSFLQQAREFREFDQAMFSRLARIISEGGKDHPWTVIRASELAKWVDAGDYQTILDNPAGPSTSSPGGFNAEQRGSGGETETSREALKVVGAAFGEVKGIFGAFVDGWKDGGNGGSTLGKWRCQQCGFTAEGHETAPYLQLGGACRGAGNIRGNHDWRKVG
jgi:Zn-dependent protease with chaperone function